MKRVMRTPAASVEEKERETWHLARCAMISRRIRRRSKPKAFREKLGHHDGPAQSHKEKLSFLKQLIRLFKDEYDNVFPQVAAADAARCQIARN
jgi:hypothetical protein